MKLNEIWDILIKSDAEVIAGDARYAQVLNQAAAGIRDALGPGTVRAGPGEPWDDSLAHSGAGPG